MVVCDAADWTARDQLRSGQGWIDAFSLLINMPMFTNRTEARGQSAGGEILYFHDEP